MRRLGSPHRTIPLSDQNPHSAATERLLSACLNSTCVNRRRKTSERLALNNIVRMGGRPPLLAWHPEKIGGVLALIALLTGCFDVSTVDVAGSDGGTAKSRGANLPALLIDDFEDANRSPSDPQFWHWQCSSYNSPGTPPASCYVSTPGSYSNYAYSVDFALADSKNDIPTLDYPGMVLQTLTMAPLDLSRYANIVFSAKLVPRDTPLPEPVTVRISLNCSTVTQQAEPWAGVFSIGNAVQPTSYWQSFKLALSTFIQFEWNRDFVPINERACATLVDGIRFDYQPDLTDGASTAATFAIDNVYLQ